MILMLTGSTFFEIRMILMELRRWKACFHQQTNVEPQQKAIHVCCFIPGTKLRKSESNVKGGQKRGVISLGLSIKLLCSELEVHLMDNTSYWPSKTCTFPKEKVPTKGAVD